MLCIVGTARPGSAAERGYAPHPIGGDPHAQHAGFRLPAGAASPSIEASDGAPLRSASLLKPLYFWAAGHLAPQPLSATDWEELAEPSVTVSANDPTSRMWDAAGADRLLGRLAELTGVEWPFEQGGERSWGRVLVSAGQVAAGYAAFAAAAREGDEHARRLLAWMRAVPEVQTFGARAAAAAGLGVAPDLVAVKTGWFCDRDETALRTHAVTLTELHDSEVLGAVALTAIPVDAAIRDAYARTYRHGPEVLPVHWQHAAATIVETILRAARRPEPPL